MGAVGSPRSLPARRGEREGEGDRRLGGAVGGGRGGKGGVVVVFALTFGVVGIPGGGEDLELSFDGAHADQGEGGVLVGGEQLLDGAHVAGDGLAVEVELLGDGGIAGAGAEEMPDAVAQRHLSLGGVGLGGVGKGRHGSGWDIVGGLMRLGCGVSGQVGGRESIIAIVVVMVIVIGEGSGGAGEVGQGKRSSGHATICHRIRGWGVQGGGDEGLEHDGASSLWLGAGSASDGTAWDQV